MPDYYDLSLFCLSVSVFSDVVFLYYILSLFSFKGRQSWLIQLLSGDYSEMETKTNINILHTSIK